MKLLKNFTCPVTVEQLNGELCGIGAQIIDIAENGPESLALYFDHYDGTADCLRVSAQRGPQGAPVLSVEYLPAEGDDAKQSAAEDPAKALVALWDEHTGGFYIADRCTNTVVDAGPYTLDAIAELWPDTEIKRTEFDGETDAE